MYVIVRSDGKYVAKLGRAESYTSRLEDARIFRTYDDARRERCPENEGVLSVEDILNPSE